MLKTQGGSAHLATLIAGKGSNTQKYQFCYEKSKLKDRELLLRPKHCFADFTKQLGLPVCPEPYQDKLLQADIMVSVLLTLR